MALASVAGFPGPPWLNNVCGDQGRRLRALMEGYGWELRRHGIATTTINPGFVVSEMTAHDRVPDAVPRAHGYHRRQDCPGDPAAAAQLHISLADGMPGAPAPLHPRRDFGSSRAPRETIQRVTCIFNCRKGGSISDDAPDLPGWCRCPTIGRISARGGSGRRLLRPPR